MANEQLPNVSVQFERLYNAAVSFSQQNETNNRRMQDILCELHERSLEWEEVQDETKEASFKGRVYEALGWGLGMFTAYALGSLAPQGAPGVKVALAAGSVALLGYGVAKSGSTTVRNTDLKKSERAREIIRSVKQLNEEFIAIMEQQKNILEEIKNVSDELEKKHSMRTTAGTQAKKTLSEIKEFQKLQRNINELRQDAKATPFIPQLAQQCEKTVDEFRKMKNELKAFD